MGSFLMLLYSKARLLLAIYFSDRGNMESVIWRWECRPTRGFGNHADSSQTLGWKHFVNGRSAVQCDSGWCADERRWLPVRSFENSGWVIFYRYLLKTSSQKKLKRLCSLQRNRDIICNEEGLLPLVKLLSSNHQHLLENAWWELSIPCLLHRFENLALISVLPWGNAQKTKMRWKSFRSSMVFDCFGPSWRTPLQKWVLVMIITVLERTFTARFFNLICAYFCMSIFPIFFTVNKLGTIHFAITAFQF